jgi:hypothetical protein
MYSSLAVAGTRAVKKMRLEQLSKGIPFMINSRDLPDAQCYLEYANGIIKLAQICADHRDFEIIQEYSLMESDLIRRRFHLA